MATDSPELRREQALGISLLISTSRMFTHLWTAVDILFKLVRIPL
jgi:hypothetical protein